jgi:hypothetical protein
MAGDCRRRITELDVALSDVVCTSVQMLEIALETCHFVPLFERFGAAA